MDDEQQNLKGGHAPAEKMAGGVRIARKARVSESEKNNAAEKASREEHESTEVVEARNVLAHTGLAAQTNRDYPPEAIRAYHEKPLPQHCNPSHKPIASIVFQPTKQ
uniref:Death-associated protein 1 n=1 Tax=Parascaris univalens TaxID=6257 RepID=A0A915ABY9_PARUN